MPLPHKNSGNEYFVLTEPNAALTDTAGSWGALWGKQHTEPQHTEPEPQQLELQQELHKLREENNDLKSKNSYLEQSNRIYIAKIRTKSKLEQEIQKLSIHIYYLLKAAEEKNQKHAILDRSAGMKTEFQQEYAGSVGNFRFSQAFMQEMKKLNDFMKNPQFDDADEIIQDRVQYTLAKI
jgi:hypothetical protein